MSRPSVLITGGGFTNKGAEAMVLTVADALRERLPDLDIYVIAPFREAGVIQATGLVPTGRGNPKSPVSHLSSILRTVYVHRTCSALIDVGGYQFGGPWGVKRAREKARLLKGVVARGAPVFFMPQAWGPFSSQELGDTTREIVAAATVCFVRDKASMRMMESLVGSSSGKIRFAHDIAWNFRGMERSNGEKLLGLPGCRCDLRALTVAVTPNLRVYEKTQGSGAQNEYIGLFLNVIKHLCSAHNAQIVLIGHELAVPGVGVHDDRMLCRMVLDLLDGKWPVKHIDAYLSAAEVKSIIGCCDLLLSSRYHALIAALSQNVPVIAVGWSHKYGELLEEMGLSGNTLHTGDPLEQVLASVGSVVERLVTSRALIKCRIPDMKASATATLGTMVSGVEACL